jgi:hypothetical protein
MPNNYNKDEQEIIKKIHAIMKERNLVFISLFKLEGVLRVRLSHSYWDDGYYTPLLPAFEFKLTDKTPFNNLEEGLIYNQDEIIEL